MASQEGSDQARTYLTFMPMLKTLGAWESSQVSAVVYTWSVKGAFSCVGCTLYLRLVWGRASSSV